MKIPSIVIAGTNSGCGKTTITMGIMAALAERGLRVQPYKVGPDFIDPMFHTFITGRESRNLDSWMLGEETVKCLFAKNSKNADIAVTEGVMGLYDGYGGRSSEGSTAHVSKIIGSPVILVVNGEAMALSAAALVKGFVDFDKDVKVKGVILNNIYGEGHYRLLKEVIEENTGIPVMGCLSRKSEISIADRHLGLVTSAEIIDLKEKVHMLSQEIQRTVDLDGLIKLSRESGDVEETDMPAVQMVTRERVRIAVARDKAFCFYYRDSLELLETLGAELVFFSPLNDGRLPGDIDGLYIGGGYPELWAEQLQNNLSMRKDIKAHIESGMPAYAECGGLMYMTDSIMDKAGRKFSMVGLIPGESRMTGSLNRFGYVFVKLIHDTILAKRGSEIRAHEFHFSESLIEEHAKACYEVARTRDRAAEKPWSCGFAVHNLLAGYAHLHFWANPEFAAGFINSCVGYNLKNKHKT